MTMKQNWGKMHEAGYGSAAHIKSWQERVNHGDSIYAKAMALECEVAELRELLKEAGRSAAPLPDRFAPTGTCTCAGPDGPCESCISNREAYEEWLAERGQAAPLPAGWKLVPPEMTPEMERAAKHWLGKSGSAAIRLAYRSVLAAAPAVSAPPTPTDDAAWKRKAAAYLTDLHLRQLDSPTSHNYFACAARDLLEGDDAPTAPAWCEIHQHHKWCEHNGGVQGPTGWRSPLHPRLKDTPYGPAIMLEDVRDAERFRWYFSDKPKGEWLLTYLDGMRAGWTTDQWRAAIDAAMLKGEAS